ncbi:MAG: cysteine peptidase family C39 domain-containing protein [Candidatus Moranbacteria bacterium]|nr:cysteine peptidase family C39 domain-containing protein [Candidatus Moranbacteria bacterium]
MLDVKPYRQKPGFCGPASLKMVLDFYGVEKSEEELGEITKCNPDKGITGFAIVKAAKKLGFAASLKDSARLKDIKKFLTKGIPVIVEWFSEDDGHFSVVVEMDQKYIYLQDPELAGVRKMDLETFERVWFSFDTKIIRKEKDLVLRRMVVVEKEN